jgi:hypothetical protein
VFVRKVPSTPNGSQFWINVDRVSRFGYSEVVTGVWEVQAFESLPTSSGSIPVAQYATESEAIDAITEITSAFLLP